MRTFWETVCDIDNHPYVIAEIGANHNGDMGLAKEMIDAARECGADAVKFQSWSNHSLIAKSEYEKNQTYNDSKKKHFGSLYEMVSKYALTVEQHHELNAYCIENRIQFCSTPFSMEEADLLESLDVPFYKIASMDIDNLTLIKYVAQKGKPVILSTGMASLKEIAQAVEVVESQGCEQIVILHCVSIYPPKMESVNLRNISMLDQAFPCSVGFSDHSIGTQLPIASTVLGARVLEKHFTTDKDLPGWDHAISADPSELSEIVSGLKDVSKALGKSARIVSSAELDKRRSFRRSLVYRTDLPKGHILCRSDLTAKRPGTGVSDSAIGTVLGRTLSQSVTSDDLVSTDDFN